MNGAILELRNVVKSYGDQPVLDGVSFSCPAGETKIIIGASGSGKSTILKLVMGLEKPDEGQILIDGEDITDSKNERWSASGNGWAWFSRSPLFSIR